MMKKIVSVLLIVFGFQFFASGQEVVTTKILMKSKIEYDPSFLSMQFVFSDTEVKVKNNDTNKSYILNIDKIVKKDFRTMHPNAIWYFCTDPNPEDSKVTKYIIIDNGEKYSKSIHFFAIINEVTARETIYAQ
ncbi:MAG: hypothetical protein A2W90_14590 [Bacteroidetes bacterium GWF2_42_66]|nr:MAG: hypothetical protein A2W92_15985 [Bacteroidetes bacterium GWA2_42_15]OFX99077.1 MAG: hypothetical protein A2W89_06670 [Bacteroidetes bacterium GWE2_42_39]OFY46754.1 MAG: hypothetical protein A2W90_14590 [Bacteroidetes bacterium GWF2_42_66]HAZ00701.1 hypothetical protein [Marinilabiliales bacterium]HBL73839.1 hypothetical protein [Prolixibacteraceae bacterium]